MASAQAMEEELQQSVLASDTTDWAQDASTTNTTSHSANKTIAVQSTRRTRSSRDQDMDEEDRDASGEDVEEEEEDAEGEDDIDLFQALDQSAEPQADGENQLLRDEDEEEDADGDGDGDEDEDEDAEGEEVIDGEDEDVVVEDEETEGVGAVKTLAPESDAEDPESDASDLASGAEDEEADEDSDAEEDVAWEDARADAEEQDDDESEAAATNVCIFCKQDEEHDPSEDFEAYMSCRGCEKNAHQQCAREEDAMDENNDAKHWRCPSCYSEESEAEDGDDRQSQATDERPVSQRSNVPKMARDLLAVETGSVDGDSHSVFNELVLDDGPKDGSRHLRKRKTSSIEPDDSIVSLRKRRRNTSAEDTNDDATEGAKSGEATGSRPARTLRLKVSKPPPATIEKHTRSALVIKLHVRPGNLKEIMSRKKRDKKRPAGASRPPRPVAPPPARGPSHTPVPMIETPFTAESYSQPFYSFFDRDTDDAKGKPYGGILSENEADTSKTLPQSEDRHRFDQAKRRADAEWRARVLDMQAESEIPIRKHKKNDHASQIECIEFGGWEIDTWYAAPYPAEYSRNRVLYICEFCLKYMNSDYVAWRHKLKCAAKHPPGDEIYRHGSVSFFEVDGRKNPVYCQNLCLLAKLFLGSKTLYYDVEPFLFYVLCEYDETGYHFVGYFSKEKRSSSQNNVSCILTLPIHQRKGYGNLLIDFSYLLTKVEEKTGSPEKPLSDLGLVSYRSYWRLILCRYLLDIAEKEDHNVNGLSIKQISDDTAMTPDDVIAALEGLRALVRDPQTKVYAFRADLEFCRSYVSNWESKGHVKLKPEALAWTPYVMGRGNASHFELGPISTVAPRAEDEARIDEGPNGIGAETQPQVNGVKDVAAVDDAVVTPVEADIQLKAEAASQPGKVADGDKENAAPEEADSGPMDVDANEEDWDVPYKDIPPSRFEVFPPAPSRGRRERTYTGVSRPTLQQTMSSSSAPRPRPKRPAGGSARRTPASRPKASSARRKSGGTGRGPGRWPKGTKKADYGNADSGPGFPPGWKAETDTPSKAEGAASKLGKEDVAVVVSDVDVDVGDDDVTNAQAVEDNDEDVDAEGEDA